MFLSSKKTSACVCYTMAYFTAQYRRFYALLITKCEALNAKSEVLITICLVQLGLKIRQFKFKIRIRRVIATNYQHLFLRMI